MPAIDAPDRPIPAALESLYREVVLDHYRHPRNRDPLSRVDGEATVHNPVCGDQVRVQVCVEAERLRDVSARTRGCSIAVAAGSVMSELTRGLPIADVGVLYDTLRGLIAGRPAAADLDPRLRAFAAVAPLRSRHRCALLAWEALEEAIEAATPKAC